MYKLLEHVLLLPFIIVFDCEAEIDVIDVFTGSCQKLLLIKVEKDLTLSVSF